ncbi:MAG: hypothetical protein H0X29_02250 [Parachlamydiaceae bacterium]|nr:hypothetical protein [Parachlamydiaceae bacterium]
MRIPSSSDPSKIEMQKMQSLAKTSRKPITPSYDTLIAKKVGHAIKNAELHKKLDQRIQNLKVALKEKENEITKSTPSLIARLRQYVQRDNNSGARMENTVRGAVKKIHLSKAAAEIKKEIVELKQLMDESKALRKKTEPAQAIGIKDLNAKFEKFKAQHTLKQAETSNPIEDLLKFDADSEAMQTVLDFALNLGKKFRIKENEQSSNPLSFPKACLENFREKWKVQKNIVNLFEIKKIYNYQITIKDIENFAKAALALEELARDFEKACDASVKLNTTLNSFSKNLNEIQTICEKSIPDVQKELKKILTKDSKLLHAEYQDLAANLKNFQKIKTVADFESMEKKLNDNNKKMQFVKNHSEKFDKKLSEASGK